MGVMVDGVESYGICKEFEEVRGIKANVEGK